MGAVTKEFLLQKAAYPARFAHAGVRECIVHSANAWEARERLTRLQHAVVRALENIASVPDEIKIII